MAGLPSSINSVANTIADAVEKRNSGMAHTGSGQKFWHGPYWIWTRKECGKTVSKTLSKEQAATVRKAINEMKDLNQIIEKWRAQSLKEIEKI